MIQLKTIFKFSESFWLALIQVANMVSVVGVSAYVGNVSSNSELGLVLFGFSLISILAVLSDFSFNQHGIKFVINNSSETRFYNYLLDFLLIKSVFFGFLFLLSPLVIFFYSATTKKEVFFFLCISASFFSSIIPAWLYQGLGRIRDLSIIVVAARSLFVVLLWIGFKPVNPEFVALANLIAYFFATFVSLYPFVKKIQIQKFSRKRLKKRAYLNLAMTGPRVIYVFSLLVPQTLLLKSIGPTKSYAVFMVMDQLYKSISAVFVPIYQALYISRVRDRSYKKAVQFRKYFIALSVVGFGLGLLVGKDFVRFTYGVDIEDQEVFYTYLIIYSLFVVSSYGRSVLIPVFLSVKSSNYSLGYQGIVTITLSIFFYLFFDASASDMALVILGAELFSFVHREYLFKKNKYRVS